MVPLKGHIKAANYIMIIEQHLVLFMENLGPGFRYEQDSSSTHTTTTTGKYTSDRAPALAGEVSRSRLNRKCMTKAYVDKCPVAPKTLCELANLFMEAWANVVNEALCERLFGTMPFRLDAAIGNADARTRY